MSKKTLPAVRLQARPAGLKFQPPKAALDRFDRGISVRAAGEAAAGGEIEILGEICDTMWGGVDARTVKAQLDAIGAGPVLVWLNSPGGDVFEGIAIYNVIRAHPGPVTMRVIGMAASAASVIAMAGDRIEMGEAASIMIHSAWSLVVGNKDDLREFADFLDQIDTAVAGIYAARTGKTVDEITQMMAEETWMFGPEAVKQGFADADLGAPAKPSKAKASAAAPVFARVPAAQLAAPGDRPRPAVNMSARSPGVPGPVHSSTQGPKMKIAEQIASFEAKRAANVARMEQIMAAAGEQGRTLDDAESQEYDALNVEVGQVDQHIVRLKAHEAAVVARATPVIAAQVNGDAATAGAVRSGSGAVISVRSNAEKGIAFTRYVKALAMARGNLPHALAIAQNNKDWKDTTPQVERVLMTAVAGGDTTTSGWASELVYKQDLVGEFIELLRPATILGKMTGLTRVPFNVRMSGQDSGSSANWVGQGKAIPVSKLHTLEVTLGIAKAAGLVVLTEELVRSSAPSAEMLVQNDLMKTIATFLDVQFVDPNVAAVANVSPASITNGVTPVVPTGTTSAYLRADIQTLVKNFINDNQDLMNGVWIMDPVQALAISMMQNSLGQPVFPGMTMRGGVFEGLPAIVSNSANIPGSPDSGHMIILCNAPEILLADDGGLTVDVSREASIEMTDAPGGDAAAGTAGTTSLVSMFQESAVALKCVRFINWKKRRSTAVAYIKEAAYVS